MPAPSSNTPEYTVSQLSSSLKRTIEDAYGYVRVRGELGRVTRAGSGHVYLDLKDERAVLSSVVWKGAAARMKVRPEQGMEVIATGRLTTFPGQSRYQLVIDTLEPAGAGALMALFEERKKQLAAEGLFAAERKRPLPFLPRTIGVVTSPSGAVIRDILHRLRDRFPSHVLVWPALVQGERAAAQIVAGIEGFNRLPEGFPRPDVLIVGRGGGSLEDLWCFNDEAVVRAVAASGIPVISAVGHETDTTLIDYAADRRAPTPTAAAEMAVPVRMELLSEVESKGARLSGAVFQAAERRALALTSAIRGLGRPEALIEPVEQRFDRATERLGAAMRSWLERAETRFSRAEGRLRPSTVLQALRLREQTLREAGRRLPEAPLRGIDRAQQRVAGLRLRPLGQAATERAASRLSSLRLTPAAGRRLVREAEEGLGGASERLARSTSALDRLSERLAAQERLLRSYSYQGVLERGFALVTAEDGSVLRRAAETGAGQAVTLRFADDERSAVIGADAPKPPRKKAAKAKAAPKKAEAGEAAAPQPTLFE
ncbi:exodeoxyribonuclease VII large subunit [Parvularcula oceani]|uniref:exodeoxyribonuclease VII large subunit n=1 Tax=Parvularcula oceani TaxID=1247963 RepID=UPI00055B8E7A|nr:exodeoxyribonuclease VII large subunit [Parvularcula oceani]